MKKQFTHLKTVRNYANSVTLESTGKNPTIQYIYQMINNGKIACVEIDGVKFIDTKNAPK